MIELERDVVRDDDVEPDDQQRRDREVVLPGREPGVEVGRPPGEPPRQQVVAEVRRPPHVRAHVAAGRRWCCAASGRGWSWMKMKTQHATTIARPSQSSSVPPRTAPRSRGGSWRRRRAVGRRVPATSSRRASTASVGALMRQSSRPSSPRSLAGAGADGEPRMDQARARSRTWSSGHGRSSASQPCASHRPHRRNVTGDAAHVHPDLDEDPSHTTDNASQPPSGPMPTCPTGVIGPGLDANRTLRPSLGHT